jgi:hypothetical protein
MRNVQARKARSSGAERPGWAKLWVEAAALRKKAQEATK